MAARSCTALYAMIADLRRVTAGQGQEMMRAAKFVGGPQEVRRNPFSELIVVGCIPRTAIAAGSAAASAFRQLERLTLQLFQLGLLVGGQDGEDLLVVRLPHFGHLGAG